MVLSRGEKIFLGLCVAAPLAFLGAALAMSEPAPLPAAANEPLGAAAFVPRPVAYNAVQTAEHTYDFRTRWVNYMDAEGEWKTIDPSVRTAGDHFEMSAAPFTFRAPFVATGEAEFASTNRYDIFEEREIVAPTVSSFTRALGVDSVVGELEDLDGDGKTESVVYRGAYAALSADLIYTVAMGRAPHLVKLVRFNRPPSEDQDVSFLVRFTGGVEHAAPTKKVVTLGRARPEGDVRAQALHDRSLSRARYERLKAPVRAGSLPLAHRAETDPSRGIGWFSPMIWDSGAGEEQKRAQITYDFSSTGEPDEYILTKHVKAAFFTDAVLPVSTDVTATFNPDPSVEVTSVDGYSGRGVTPEIWATKRDFAGDDSNDSAATTAFTFLAADTCPLWGELRRGFLLFDTSAIADTDTIDAAQVSLAVNALTTTLGSQSVRLVTTTPASNTAIANGDYQSIGVTALATDKTMASMAAGTRADWEMNATGLAQISQTGVTRLGTRFVSDATNAEPTCGSGQQANMNINTADQTGTASDPQLIVTSTAAVAAALGSASLYQAAQSLQLIE